ncbi:MAG TPA: outer membrane protein transport protein [Lentimicrobium sp.]|nr:outer membrane protein transport protein [Lentimicrobium sp.]
MKKITVLIMVFVALTVSVNAQMDNLSNLSAKWIGSNVRNATLDGSGDMVNFNPAGLAMQKDGIYISVSNQFLFRHPQHTYNFGAGSVTREQDGNDPLLPMVYGAWKKNNIAISTGVYISGGGAAVNYPDGSINTTLVGFQMLPALGAAYGYTSFKDQSLKASSFYITVPLNFSYKFNDELAVSIGGRYLMGNNKTKAGMTFTGSEAAPDYDMTIDYIAKASGIGGVVGVDYKPCEKINVAIHYESKVKLEFEASDNKGTFKLEDDGKKSRRDLPAALNTGITYDISKKLIAAVDFNYYFQKNADWGKIVDPRTGQTLETSKVAGDCFKLGLGGKYLLNEKFEFSLGGSYTAYNYDDMELYYTKMGPYEVLKYSNINIGLGAGYNVTKKIQIDLGFMKTFWKDQTIASLYGGIPVDVQSAASVVALGIDFRF